MIVAAIYVAYIHYLIYREETYGTDISGYRFIGSIMALVIGGTTAALFVAIHVVYLFAKIARDSRKNMNDERIVEGRVIEDN